MADKRSGEYISPPAVPFQYTNRDYRTLKQSLVDQVRARVPGWNGYNDPNDFGLALIESFAYLADGLHYYLDRVANEAYLRSASRPESIRAISNLFGYRPSPASSASVDLIFTNNIAESIVVPQGTVVQTAAVDSQNLAPVYFETSAEITLPAMPDSIEDSLDTPVPAVEGITFSGDDGYGEVLGVSDGTNWQIYSLPRAPVLEGFIQVYVSYSDTWNNRWTQIEDIRSSLAGDTSYQVEYTPQGAALLRFGSATSGYAPPAGSLIKCLYRIGGGTRGNVSPDTLTVIADDLSLAGVSVTNAVASVGGADRESVDSIRANTSWTGRTAANHAVTLRDFEKIALAHVSVGKSSASALDPSVIRVTVAPIDDGTLRPGLEEIAIDSGTPTTLIDPCGNIAPIGSTTTTQMSSYFSTDVMPAVERSLQDASFAGAEIQVGPPCYVKLFIRIDVVHPEVAPEALRATVLDRLRRAFSYKYVSLGLIVRPFDLTKMLAGIYGVDNVTVTRLTRDEMDQTGLNNIKLSSNEIPYVEIEDDDVRFLSPDEEGGSDHGTAVA